MQPESKIYKIYKNLVPNLNFSQQDLETVVAEGSNYIIVNNRLKQNKTQPIISEQIIKGIAKTTLQEKEKLEELEKEEKRKEGEPTKKSLEVSNYYKQNGHLPTIQEKINEQVPFTTYEDILILLGTAIEMNHSTNSIRMRKQRLLEKFNESEIDQFAKMNLQRKRELLARKFNGKKGERIKLNVKQEEMIERLDRLEKILNKLAKKSFNQ